MYSICSICGKTYLCKDLFSYSFCTSNYYRFVKRVATVCTVYAASAERLICAKIYSRTASVLLIIVGL